MLHSLDVHAGGCSERLDRGNEGFLSDGVSVLGVGEPLSGLCEYIVRSRSDKGGDHGRHEALIEREYSVFRFSASCGLIDLNNVFQLGSGVVVDDIPDAVKAYAAAKRIVMNPEGLGWMSPMVLLKKAELENVVFINRNNDLWDVDVRVCEDGGDGRSCRMAGFSFPSEPRSLQDVRAYWID